MIIKIHSNGWKILFLLFFCSFISICKGQSKIDSLLSDLSKCQKDDIKKVTLYKEISKAFYFSNKFDSAVTYARKGLELSQKISYEIGIAENANSLGIFYKNKATYDSAIKYFFRSLEIKTKLNDQKGIASTSNNIGGIYEEHLISSKDAKRYYLTSLRYYDLLKDTVHAATVLMNIGNTFLLEENYDSALCYYDRAKPIIESGSDKLTYIKLIINIGESYEKKNIPDSSTHYLLKALTLCQATNNKDLYATACLYYGRYLLEKKQYSESFHFLSLAYNISRSVDVKSLRIQTLSAEQLSIYFKSIKEYDSALFYAQEFIHFKDSLSSSEHAIKLAVQETSLRYDNQLRENKLKLDRQRLVRNLMILLSLMGIALTIYIYRSYRHKQKANKLLAEIDQMKTRMYTNISHELRTPLTLILGPLEDMLEKDARKKPTAQTVEMMQRNANRLLSLVNQMLDLSKLDAGSLKLELVEGDVIRELRQVVLSFSSRADRKKITYTYSFNPSSFSTWFDHDKLEKILTNLLSNAFKFTPEEGTITVEVSVKQGKQHPVTRKIHDMLVIRVSDTGRGIPADKRDKIFERFYQLDQSSQPDQVGTGIGLALTRELTELMHGTISVESEMEKGTSFAVDIPLGKDHLNGNEYTLKKGELIPRKIVSETGEEGIPPIPEEKEENLDQPLLLVVDDHADIRTHIREHVEADFRVVEAEDGIQGAEKAYQCVPDLIVTDLMMPNRDGVEMTRILKTDERTSHIPVIMLTAKASVEDRIEGLETGADDYITKPFHMKELKVRIGNLVEQRKRLREKYRKELILEPKEIAVNSTDERFLVKAMDVIEKNLGDPDFNIEKLQGEVGMSRVQLFRKTKALTDHTPNDLIRTYRLKRAAQLLEQDFGNVAQVTYEVGFNNLSYFAKCFREQYGVNPSEYGRKK
jgi:signal transduction histidine kinase/DNA-binding response OmpR family regulator